MKFTGRVWKFGDEINTDLIFPHSAFRASPDEQCRLCMSDNRPGWSAQVQPGDILIAGKNFGTGSSRPIGWIDARMAKLVVPGSFILVGQHFIGFVDLFEPGLGLFITGI